VTISAGKSPQCFRVALETRSTRLPSAKTPPPTPGFRGAICFSIRQVASGACRCTHSLGEANSRPPPQKRGRAGGGRRPAGQHDRTCRFAAQVFHRAPDHLRACRGGQQERRFRGLGPVFRATAPGGRSYAAARIARRAANARHPPGNGRLAAPPTWPQACGRPAAPWGQKRPGRGPPRGIRGPSSTPSLGCLFDPRPRGPRAYRQPLPEKHPKHNLQNYAQYSQVPASATITRESNAQSRNGCAVQTSDFAAPG